MPAPQGYIQRDLEQDKPKDENSHFFLFGFLSKFYIDKISAN